MIHYLLPLYEKFEPFTSLETSIEELADIWNCSTRYAKTIVKVCCESKWIAWETFKGRGKKPRLTIQMHKLKAIYIAFDEQWKKGHYDKAYKILHEYQLLSNTEVSSWLNERYGISKSSESVDVFRHPYPKIELNVDPIKLLSRHDNHIAQHLFETLFNFCPKTQQVSPNLVFAYRTEVYRVWRFVLRKDVTFHNGAKLTSKDVVASLNRAMPIVSNIFKLEKIVAVSKYSLVITLKKPNALLPRILSTIKMSILSHDWIKDGAIGVPVGCGPFQLTKFTRELMRLTAFRNYFKERPWIDEVEIIHTPETINFGLSATSFDNTIPQKKQISYEQGADFILLNATTNSSLQDEQLRKTIYSLIHPLEYCLADETVANSFLLDGEELDAPLIERVLSSEFPKLKIGVQQIREKVNHLREAKILSERLKKYGICHEIEFVPYRALTEEIAQTYDIYVGGLALGQDKIMSLLSIYQSIHIPVKSFAHEKAKRAVDQLIQQVYICSEEQKAIQLFKDVENIMQKASLIKFLSHRLHKLYIRYDSPFAGIEMEANGKIDYTKIFRI